MKQRRMLLLFGEGYGSLHDTCFAHDITILQREMSQINVPQRGDTNVVNERISSLLSCTTRGELIMTVSREPIMLQSTHQPTTILCTHVPLITNIEERSPVQVMVTPCGKRGS